MPKLVLGPMLRYLDESRATVWVETDTACTVQVLGGSARTFQVSGHHYALVLLEGLEPAADTPYTCCLDGVQVWPEPGSRFPHSVIRTGAPWDRLRLVFGSCRVTAPHTEAGGPAGHKGVDALRALAARMIETPTAQWPDLLLMLGDQVYADAVSAQTLQFIRGRRDTRRAPGEQVADFEEYTHLYREAWSEPLLRWLFSTLPTAMIFDDHDIHDDWNTSADWRAEMQSTPWWSDRIAGGLAAYWLYQHLGNLPPQEIERDDLLRRLRSAADGGALLREYALAADRELDGRKGDGVRWSYSRDFAGIRLLVVDSRCGRVLESGRRRMVDNEEWAWIDRQARGDFDHLLIASSLPVLLPPAIHDVEAWNEAVCAGAWGGRMARWAERVRQTADLEHWAAFRRSFESLTALAADVAAGRRGRPPAMVCFLSGDVHFSYLAEVRGQGPGAARVFQAVCSPVRNPVQRSMQVMDRFTGTRLGRRLGRALARSAGVPDPAAPWQLTLGPWFQNCLSVLELFGRTAKLTFESAVPGHGEDDPRLQVVHTARLV